MLLTIQNMHWDSNEFSFYLVYLQKRVNIVNFTLKWMTNYLPREYIYANIWTLIETKEEYIRRYINEVKLEVVFCYITKILFVRKCRKNFLRKISTLNCFWKWIFYFLSQTNIQHKLFSCNGWVCVWKSVIIIFCILASSCCRYDIIL